MPAWKEYVGAVILEIDGREYEVIDVSVTHDTGKKIVKTMNSTGKALGFCRGVETFELQCTAAIPVNDDFYWGDLAGSKITVYPVSQNGRRVSFVNCLAQKIGEKYEAENEARRDFTLLAQDRIVE